MIGYMPKKFKIKSVKKYTNDVNLFKVKCNLSPKPGTFLEVSIPGVGECPLASCSYDNKYVELLTRNVGKVTSAMFNLDAGDSIQIRGPYGKGFPLEKLKGKNLIMVAGGTGIAPITSMINYVEKNRKNYGKVWIYFGFRNERCILLNDRIEKWKEKFHLHVGLTQDKETHKYEKGFINEIMEKHKPKTKNTVALLCGPEGMMETVTEELHKLGITNNKVYWSLERRMECGFGSCGRCQIQDVYVCKDGPIFRYDIIKPRLNNENWSNKKE